MKSWIYGRRQGSFDDYELLVESEGVKNTGEDLSLELLQRQREFELNNLYRNVDLFREKSVEGYVVLENNSLQYKFTPNEKFSIPPNNIH